LTRRSLLESIHNDETDTIAVVENRDSDQLADPAQLSPDYSPKMNKRELLDEDFLNPYTTKQ
jgi:hypothetical protein